MSRILVVDDSKTQRMLARMILESEGYEVVEAEDGPGALAAASQESPDCILLDLNLPGESGQEVMQALHQEGHSMPVIIFSAGVDESTKRECLQIGAAAVIDKPDDAKQLDELIQGVLSG